MGFKCTACGTIYTAQHPRCGKCGSPFLAYTEEEGSFWGKETKTPVYSGGSSGSGGGRKGGCVGPIFFVIAALTVLIYFYQFLGENEKRNTDEKYAKLISLRESAKKDTTKIIIDDLEKKRYKINNSDEISQINENVGFPNDGNGFYLIEKSDDFIIGITLKRYIYDRYYSNIKTEDEEYTTHDRDMTTATFQTKKGEQLSFEKVVRLKRIDIEQEDANKKNFIFELVKGVGALLILIVLIRLIKKRKKRKFD